jgi:hypothetical protein
MGSNSRNYVDWIRPNRYGAFNYIVHNAKNSMESGCDLVLSSIAFLDFKVFCENCIELD